MVVRVPRGRARAKAPACKLIAGATVSTDRDLVIAARAGEAWAAGALYRRHRKMVARVASRLEDGHDRDDLVQDVFLMALRSLDQIDHPELFAGWLCAVVTRAAATRLRRERRRARHRQNNTGTLEHLAWRPASPDVFAELEGIYLLLERLPVEARLVFILCRVEGLSIPEVAARLERSVTTVKRRLVRAERLLDRRLADVRRPRVRISVCSAKASANRQ